MENKGVGKMKDFTRKELIEKIGKLQAENKYLKERTEEIQSDLISEYAHKYVEINEEIEGLKKDRIIAEEKLKDANAETIYLEERLYQVEQAFLEKEVYDK